MNEQETVRRSKYSQRSPHSPIPTPLWDNGTTAVSPGGKKWTWHEIKAYSFFRKNAGGVMGRSALGAIDLARAERDADDYGLTVIWEMDTYTEIDWSSDSASAMNRCAHEHDSRHHMNRESSGGTGEAHQWGNLYSKCPYSREVELWSATVVRLCGECSEMAVWERPCRNCEHLNSLHGIDLGSDSGLGSNYKRVVEAELLEDAISEEQQSASMDMDVSRARGREYVGRGL